MADLKGGHNTDRLVPTVPDQCLGFMCPERSDACTDCGIAKREAELLAEEDQSVGSLGSRLSPTMWNQQMGSLDTQGYSGFDAA